MDQYTISAIVIILISYLLGSTPSAYLIAKTKQVNIFAVGSGNMGATNVARAMGFKWALLVLMLDVIKGMIAIYISRQILSDSKGAATTISAIMVIIGHNWSLFATLLTGTLRGGKGAATAFGTLLMIAPVQVIIIALIVGGLIVTLTRYVSLAVLSTFMLAFAWLTILMLQDQLDPSMITYPAAAAAMIILRHRENIQRLITGTERRFGERV